ncbi:ribokinase [Capilliphycus salinus ALCB114379]|uniref:ribokinase n=1 Tax=Capilliphycus salinus TaxID=2768948 RepID=UPI0039A73EEB
MSVIVFGSINMDLVVQTGRLPSPGETLQGDQFFTAPGGKGANQAVAAARLGALTYLVGRVGEDSFGQELLAHLNETGVQTEWVKVDSKTSSGVAMIAVDGEGENTIIIIPGANGRVERSDVDRLKNLFSNASSLLLQLEVPLAVNIAAAKEAKKAGVKIILDPAPAPESLPDELYSLIDIITPNETETKALTGLDLSDEKNGFKAADFFRERGVETVVLKLGEKGVFCLNKAGHFRVEAFPVKAVDTVAAGDAFNGAMAAAFERGLSLREAVIWGTAAGALATTKSGAQPSLPDRETFEAFLNSH